MAKKWIPILLALLLVVSQIAGAFAEAATEAEAFSTIQEALEAGKEAKYSARFDWASPSLLDDQTNAAMASLFESLSFSGRVGMLDEKSYSSMSMALDETDVFNFDLIAYNDGTSFMSSPAYGGTIAMNPEDLPQYYENLFAMMENTQGFEGMDMDSLRATMSSFMAAVEGAQEAAVTGVGEFPTTFVIEGMEIDIEQIMQQIPFEALGEAVGGVLNAALAVEQVEGNVASAAGIECARADVYTIDRDEMLAVIEVIANVLAQNDPPVDLILTLGGMTQADLLAQGLTMEQFAKGLKESFLMLPVAAQAIPEDSYFSLYNCYDEQGEVVLNIIRADFPSLPPEEGAQAPASMLELEIEWTQDCSFFYMFASSEGDGAEFLIVDSPAEVSEVDGAVETSDLLHINFTAMEQEIPLFQLGLDVYGLKTETEDTVSIQNRIIAGYYTEDDSGALGITLVQERKNDGQEILIDGEVGFTLLFADGSSVPIGSLVYSVETADPQDLPFDETTADIMYPGKMTEEEFAGWFNNVMVPSLMKAGFTIMGKLPDAFVSFAFTAE